MGGKRGSKKHGFPSKCAEEPATLCRGALNQHPTTMPCSATLDCAISASGGGGPPRGDAMAAGTAQAGSGAGGGRQILACSGAHRGAMPLRLVVPREAAFSKWAAKLQQAEEFHRAANSYWMAEMHLCCPAPLCQTTRGPLQDAVQCQTSWWPLQDAVLRCPALPCRVSVPLPCHSAVPSYGESPLPAPSMSTRSAQPTRAGAAHTPRHHGKAQTASERS